MTQPDYRLEYSNEGAWAVDQTNGDIYLLTNIDAYCEDNEDQLDLKFHKIPSQLLELIRLDMV